MARTGSVAFDQLVEKGERQLIRFVIRWCSHYCLTEHLRQPTLFEGGRVANGSSGIRSAPDLSIGRGTLEPLHPCRQTVPNALA